MELCLPMKKLGIVNIAIEINANKIKISMNKLMRINLG